MSLFKVLSCFARLKKEQRSTSAYCTSHLKAHERIACTSYAPLYDCAPTKYYYYYCLYCVGIKIVSDMDLQLPKGKYVTLECNNCYNCLHHLHSRKLLCNVRTIVFSELKNLPLQLIFSKFSLKIGLLTYVF